VTGRVVFVTGAGSGIGEATAKRFAVDGERVAVVDQDAEAAKRVVDTIRADGGTAILVWADVSDSGAVDAAVRETEDALGRVEVLVNNAAIGVAGDLLETSAADLERTLAMNVRGVFNTCRAVLPSMLDAGEGIIVNVASVVAFAAVTRRAAYTASKGAIIALTRSIAVDFMARGIRCNAVAPGTVDSPWIGRILADAPDPIAARQAMVDRQPLGRLGLPEEIAGAIRYLASPEAAFVHGSCLVIDGGFLAR
jgi:meso-butanediol dehydrogenase / (S,S)-butanediol dehydrogenase / diacetyl reductase